ncbi:hypothetical protein GQR58_003575 [Nymphon striatum]|nr:hypothetical protein GQR58_003575 [Nymphon striatum]
MKEEKLRESNFNLQFYMRQPMKSVLEIQISSIHVFNKIFRYNKNNNTATALVEWSPGSYPNLGDIQPHKTYERNFLRCLRSPSKRNGKGSPNPTSPDWFIIYTGDAQPVIKPEEDTSVIYLLTVFSDLIQFEWKTTLNYFGITRIEALTSSPSPSIDLSEMKHSMA